MVDESGSETDAESIIETSGPADKSVPVIDDEPTELVLDEADEIGNIDDGMSIQDIDEIDEIKEEA